MDFVFMDSMPAQLRFIVVHISLSLELVIVCIARCLYNFGFMPLREVQSLLFDK